MQRLIIGMLGCLVLAGCESSSMISGDKITHACPACYIVRDLSLQTVRDPEAGKILAKTYIDRIKPSCKTEENHIRIRLNPQITARRFNSENPKEIKTSYFVALVDEQNQLIAKEVFPVELEFDGSERRTYELPDDEYELTLPENIKIAQIKVYTGFQVENHQWVENKNLYERSQLAGHLP